MFESFKVEEIKKDPILRIGLITIATVLGLGLIVIIFNSVFSVYNGYGVMGRNYYGMMANGYTSPMGNIAVVFGKLLLFVSVIGLIASFVAYIKQGSISVDVRKLIPLKNNNATIICEVCNFATDQEYKFCPSCGSHRIKECIHCQTALQNVWKCCPDCGTEINTTESKVDKTENEMTTESIEKDDEIKHQNGLLAEILEVNNDQDKTEDDTVVSIVENGLDVTENTSAIPALTENKNKNQKPYEKKTEKAEVE